MYILVNETSLLTSLCYTSTESVKSKNASFEVLVVVFLRIHIFWFVTVWCWMSGFQHVKEQWGPLTQRCRVTSQNSQLYKIFWKQGYGFTANYRNTLCWAFTMFL